MNEGKEKEKKKGRHKIVLDRRQRKEDRKRMRKNHMDEGMNERMRGGKNWKE